MRMEDEIFYEPVGEENYRRIISSLETEIGRLKGELLPSIPASQTERDRQRTVWRELDRVSRYLAQIREKAFGLTQ